MVVFRFMSKEEFYKYLNSETLKNNTRHCENSRTTSVGFCFFNIEDITPTEAMHRLSGIVSFDVCAVFDVNDKLLKKSYGMYATKIENTGDFITDMMAMLMGFGQREKLNEYCTKKYNNKDFKLIKYTSDCWSQWKPECDEEDLEWRK